MASKIDSLIGALGDFSKAVVDVNKTLGQFSSDIRTLYKRADEDRAEHKREHTENQERMGEIAQSTAGSIAELRKATTERWDETTKAVEKLTVVVKKQGEKLDDHAKAVTALQAVRGSMPKMSPRIALYATVGFGTIIVVGWVLEAMIKSGIALLLARLKFGG